MKKRHASALLGLAILTGAAYGAVRGVMEELPEPGSSRILVPDSWPHDKVEAYAVAYSTHVHAPPLMAMDPEAVAAVLDGNHALASILPADHQKYPAAALLLEDQARYLSWLLEDGLANRHALERLANIDDAEEALASLGEARQAFYELYAAVHEHATKNPLGSLSILAPRHMDLAAGMLHVMGELEETEAKIHNLLDPYAAFFAQQVRAWPLDVEAFLAAKTIDTGLQLGPRSPEYVEYAAQVHVLDAVAYWLSWAQSQSWTGLTLEYHVRDDELLACGTATDPVRRYCPLAVDGPAVLNVDEEDRHIGLGLACPAGESLDVLIQSHRDAGDVELRVAATDGSWHLQESVVLDGNGHARVTPDIKESGPVVMEVLESGSRAVAAVGYAVAGLGVAC